MQILPAASPHAIYFNCILKMCAKNKPTDRMLREFREAADSMNSGIGIKVIEVLNFATRKATEIGKCV